MTCDQLRVIEFLALPVEALPQAYYISQDYSSVWDDLNEFAKSGTVVWLAYVHLQADRDGWRDGFVVFI